MKQLLSIALIIITIICPVTANSKSNKKDLKSEIPLEILMDKIKGGWAGQVIGVTYGGPTEFKFNGTMIQDYVPIPWYDGYIRKTMTEIPGLYDDVYMDLTFVEVFERLGLDAPVDSFAHAFAHAEYKLWHANQAARYNILNGIKAPQSGYWVNNPHADDIDYQIEADFAGLMSPGMPNAASEISDKIGHIMNYGDGWYGGVYVGAMYALAFVSNDIKYIVNEALKTIPKQSDFYHCMSDVIRWHKKYPTDWKKTWFELEKKWTSEIGCPDGVFTSFNINAKINSAYVLLGLLYGNGDYGKTLDISTRAGQDSDCNPATAAGILGTMIGYSKIPAYWKLGLKDAEDINFMYINMSLNKVYEISYKHALEMIRRNGGTITHDKAVIKTQKPVAVRYEKSFENTYPVELVDVKKNIVKELEFEFEGTGFVLKGSANKTDRNAEEAVLEASLYINGELIETSALPTSFTTRKPELFWKYNLPKGKYKIKIVATKVPRGYYIRAASYIVYSDAPAVYKH